MKWDDENLLETLKDFSNTFNDKEKIYRELPKDKLVDRLIMCEMELAARDEEGTAHMMELWYFVGDETGTKYLSDKKPEIYFTAKYEDFGNDGDIMYVPQQILMTDGEINIRVPKKMESMFPYIKYGDDPIKVKVANLTL